ncbi:hypothetical protein DPMN_118776 [Dreissena polymorpha]|uniref:Uncharacterized protein n=1 Tax=Dreissena polymorpha TaxID=45954 RepID=A0A9D4GKR8_DREPO|nr:hypothetical protein DPMN_118776 [Dreissena polymorpha]
MLQPLYKSFLSLRRLRDGASWSLPEVDCCESDVYTGNKQPLSGINEELISS